MSMNDHSNQITKGQGYLLLAGGVLITLVMMMIIDERILLSKIDPDNPETWPNMGTGMRYFFIPVLFLPIYTCSALVVFVCEKFIQRTKYKSWFFQGIGCGMIMSIMPMGWLDIPVFLGISLPIILSISLVTLIRIKYSHEKSS